MQAYKNNTHKICILVKVEGLVREILEIILVSWAKL